MFSKEETTQEVAASTYETPDPQYEYADSGMPQDIVGYSTTIPSNPEESGDQEEYYDDTAIPLDNVGYQSLGADRENHYYQGLYADIEWFF